ncbi:riboflavin synthase [Arcticibacterium luteifluviistationis]|uniref:Riboflavin synthase n=1 Tax=Arcticibacterium luteifluviistationis TaxID=1784714 RepID=A0A2Z4G7W0_9BACT|nr:riboflavin synthase [Arcticibacterium luteifluviistationis]AWV97262.1 riboflavin synthase [Arcticibacterium luteifluviistationis]
MFTGIVENQAKLINISQKGSNKTFTLESSIANELKIDQSISHNGVCLTVEKTSGASYEVTAIEETLLKTNLGELKIGVTLNLERCLAANGRFDGHIVQGHVDQTGKLVSVENKDGSYILTFSYEASTGNITVEKGSICINGVSLTVFNSTDNSFSVALIPYTWDHTNLGQLTVGDSVNLEFDILGKYMQKILSKTA